MSREETYHRLGISESEAAQMTKAAEESLQRRKKPTGLDSVRVRTDAEDRQLSAAGRSSQNNRTHPTSHVVDAYMEGFARNKGATDGASGSGTKSGK